ncbi:MAG: 3'-5' exonuclease, partial [Alphaproteobacteria bacterium]|nr:3'-5' exonuclease [Alphaproteobacteria bacterium]
MRRKLAKAISALRPAPLQAEPSDFDNTPLAALPAVVLDLETTGLNVVRDRVVSIGALTLTGDAVEEQTLDCLVNPGMPMPAESRAIHGIDDAMVADSDRIDATWPALMAFLTGRVIIGHQVGYDLAILRSEASRHELPWSPPPALDIMRLAAVLEPREPDLSLEGTAERWDVPVRGRHTALGDAAIAAGLWRGAISRLAAREISTFGEARAFELRARRIVA